MSSWAEAALKLLHSDLVRVATSEDVLAQLTLDLIGVDGAAVMIRSLEEFGLTEIGAGEIESDISAALISETRARGLHRQLRVELPVSSVRRKASIQDAVDMVTTLCRFAGDFSTSEESLWRRMPDVGDLESHFRIMEDELARLSNRFPQLSGTWFATCAVLVREATTRTADPEIMSQRIASQAYARAAIWYGLAKTALGHIGSAETANDTVIVQANLPNGMPSQFTEWLATSEQPDPTLRIRGRILSLFVDLVNLELRTRSQVLSSERIYLVKDLS